VESGDIRKVETNSGEDTYDGQRIDDNGINMRTPLLVSYLHHLMHDERSQSKLFDIRSMMPVVSQRVSTKRIVRFANDDILLRVLPIKLRLI
jgi:hypothetical protein